jgi:hypothetical protein
MTKKYKVRLEGSSVVIGRTKASKGATPRAEFEKLFKEGLQAATPRGRIARWRPLADKFGAGQLLDAAEALIDRRGSLTPEGLEVLIDDGERFTIRFDLLLERVISKIKDRSNEETVVPLAADAVETQEGRSAGGRNSWGWSADERKIRNEAIQTAINRLCLVRGLTYKAAREYISKKFWEIDEIKARFTEAKTDDMGKELSISAEQIRAFTIKPDKNA